MAEYLKQARIKRQADREEVSARVAGMLARIQNEGDAAVREFSRELDSWDPARFRIADDEIAAARQALPDSVVEDIDFCQAQVRLFARKQRESLGEFEVETRPGVIL